MFKGSFIFNTLVNYNDPPSEYKYYTRQAKYLQDVVDNNTLWAYPALYSFDNYIIVDDKNSNAYIDLPTQLKYENRFSNFHPYPDNMIKQAMLYWNLGDKDTARNFVNLALVAFPVYKDSYLATLKNKKYNELHQLVNLYQYNKK